MQQFNGYDNAKKEAQTSNTGTLPVGGYVCKVLNVKYVQAPAEGKSSRIELEFDIAEGEQEGFFQKKYEADTSEDKKWKGKTNIWIPKDDGSDGDKFCKKIFASWTDCFEKSNNGYIWDWDETKWKGKLIGIVFGKTGTIIEGKPIVFVEPRFPLEVEKIRSGNVPVPQFKARNGYTANSESGAPMGDDEFMNVDPNKNEELPF